MSKNFKHPKTRYAPKTENHKLFWEFLNDKSVNYLACTGPSGSAKSTLACKYAVQAMQEGKYETLHICTPIVEIDNETLGFLAGDLDQKLEPHLGRITQHLTKFKRKDDDFNVQQSPLSYLRGANIENSIFLLDEAQNCSLAELFAVFTRTDHKSKIIVLGDFAQNDLKFSDISDLEKVCNAMEGHKAFEWVELGPEDIVRSKHLAEIIERFDKIT